MYGVELTDEQLEKDYEQDELQIMKSEIGEEFFDDVVIPEYVEVELTDEEIEELDRQMERDVKKIEYEENIEFLSLIHI